MRKNHHGKKDRLVKRVFALCLALAVICTCLVPVFATEGLIDPQVHQEASRPVDDGEASYPDDECAGFGEEEATRPVDGGEAAGFGGDEVATRPVEGGEDNLEGGPSVKETEWGTVIEYDTSTSTSTDPSSSTETQWSGEDDVVEKPDDKVVVSGDEIKKLQDMVVYRFWLKELNTLDLQDITAQAQINNMTESEYLARNGEVLWNLYFIQAVPRAETIADYSSYIENPSSNRDPKGELRLFDYWYTLDEFGNRVRLNLTDPTSNILDDKTTTVNVYAAWKDGTVGSDEEEDVDHEDLVDKNPVPVDLTAKASASYEDEDGNTKSVNLPVEVKNLPSAAHSLSVIHMGDDDMESFYKSHEDDFGSMAPILGLKISPKNAKGDTVQPAKGEKATVTVSGLEKLPEIAAMEEEEALTADALKVLHQKADGSVETLDVLTYTNGTLTFETSSFSPFVVVRMDGYDVETLSITGKYKSVVVNKTITLTSDNNDLKNYDHTWKSSNNSIATVQGSDWTATVTGVKAGDVIITHEFLGYTSKKGVYRIEEKFNVTVDDLNAGTTGQWVYLYAHVSDECMEKLNLKESDKNFNGWFTLGKVWVSDLKSAGSSDFNGYSGHTRTDTETSVIDTLNKELKSNNQNGYVVRYEKNQSIDLSKVKWTYNTDYGLTRAYGANDYIDGDYTMYTWHLDGYVDDLANLEIHFYDAETNKEIKTALKEVATIDTTAYASKYSDAYPTIFYQSEQYKYYYTDTPSVTIENNKTNIINLYYAKVVPTKTVTIEKQVKGYFGDTRKEFEFSLDFGGEDISKITAARSDGSAINDLSSFTLKHGQYVTLTNVPIGATVTVTEKTPGALYGVTATGYEEAKSGATDVSYVYTIAEAADVQSTAINEAKNFEGDKIVVVNTATLFPDTGVLLDTLPYIVILAVVAGGVALLMLRKHRKEDD